MEKVTRTKFKPTKMAALGFTIFDAFHILFGITFIVIAAIGKEENYQSKIAFETIELIFAILLVGFVDGLTEESSWNTDTDRDFTYAWLVCVAAMLTPLSINFPYVFDRLNTAGGIITLIYDILILGAFLLIFSTLWMKKHTRIWFTLFLISLVCLLISVPLSVVSNCLEEEGVEMVLEIIASFAPLFPILTSYHLICVTIRDLKKQGKLK